jgi:hypothetical protein
LVPPQSLAALVDSLAASKALGGLCHSLRSPGRCAFRAVPVRIRGRSIHLRSVVRRTTWSVSSRLTPLWRRWHD